MSDLRNYINLMESVHFDQDEEEEVIETVLDEENIAEEIVDEAILDEFDAAGETADLGLEGNLDIRGLAKLLPEVDDLNRFMIAVRKVQKGDNASLSMQETRQLAKAFISLLKDDSQMTMKAMQKLKMVHTDDAM